MAARKQTTKAAPRRQVVGKDPVAVAQGTQAARGSEPKASAEERAETSAKAGLERVTHITCPGTGSFQLRKEVDEPGRDYQAEWVLNFGDRGFIAADDETVDAVKKVLAGEWSDGRIGPKVFLQNARMVGLGIKTYGLEDPPIRTWDTLSEDRALDAAIVAGELDTPDAVRKAIRYENESPERQPAREPREWLVAALKDRLRAVEDGSVAPVAPSAFLTGGAAPAIGLAGGAQELG